MAVLRIVSGSAASEGSGLKVLAQGPALIVQGQKVIQAWESGGSKFFVAGHVYGFRQADGSLEAPLWSDAQRSCISNSAELPRVEGRFVVVRADADGTCEVWADAFGRMDVYWQTVNQAVIVGTGLDLLPVHKTGAPVDQVGLMHALTVYGSRPAKQHTLYRGVGRLGIDQGLRIKGGSAEILHRSVSPISTLPEYQEADLDRYADLLLESIRARGSHNGNIVYLSSGWDSTAILASLVHIFGNRKVRAVIGRMRYSDRSGVINQFELDRARAVADYFGVRLDIVELDYRSSAGILDEVRPLFQSQQFANVTGLNHWLLAGAVGKNGYAGESVFAGEMSDGAHNLGFSQFVTIFHPASQDFREYADKMASYLFGPTFFSQMLAGKQDQDPVWNLFRSMNSSATLDSPKNSQAGLARQFLASMFLRGGRLPLYSITNSRMLTSKGQEQYSNASEKVYVEPIADRVTPDTLYGWYLRLYHSFHWQGSTVSTIEHTADAHGIVPALPYLDRGVLDFLSGMPEHWGRGLDMKPTKYPLKWMLQNRVDYPMHLQVGPHSYTYDVNPAFSVVGELLHASALAPVFRSALGSKKLDSILDPELFDRSYVDGICKRFAAGEEMRGAELTDTLSLGMLAAIDVFRS